MTDFNPLDLYTLAKRLHPEGVAGEAFIPVEVEGQKMELRYFTNRGNGTDVEFGFFRPDARYARQTVILWHDGRMELETRGVIPDFDQRDGEKPITLPMEELMRLAFIALQQR